MFAALLRLIWEKAVTDDDKRTERQRRDAEVESRAATAYDDLFTHKDRNDWAKWMFIADGLMVGRRWALAKAGTQEPVGRGYNTAFSQWMATRHWARDLDKPTRNHLFWCADHRSEIEAWRDELPPQERVKKNHPSHMRRAYLKAHPLLESEKGGESEAKKRKEKPDDTALREELFQLRGQLVAEKEEHRKTTAQRDEAYNNPLMVWQTNPQDAAIKPHHDNEQRAQAVMRSLMAEMPEDAAVVAAGIAAKREGKASLHPVDLMQMSIKAARVAGFLEGLADGGGPAMQEALADAREVHGYLTALLEQNPPTPEQVEIVDKVEEIAERAKSKRKRGKKVDTAVAMQALESVKLSETWDSDWRENAARFLASVNPLVPPKGGRRRLVRLDAAARETLIREGHDNNGYGHHLFAEVSGKTFLAFYGDGRSPPLVFEVEAYPGRQPRLLPTYEAEREAVRKALKDQWPKEGAGE